MFLKVYNGIQQGAILELKPNCQYSLGSDVAVCDIYLAEDTQPATKYVSLMIINHNLIFDEIFITEQILSSQGILDKNVTYSLPLFFTLRGSKIAIGDSIEQIDDWLEPISPKIEEAAPTADFAESMEADNIVLAQPSEDAAIIPEGTEIFDKLQPELADSDLALSQNPDSIEGNQNHSRFKLITDKLQLLLNQAKIFLGRVGSKYFAICKELMRNFRKDYPARFYLALGCIGILLLGGLVLAKIIISSNQAVVTPTAAMVESKGEIQSFFAKLPSKFANLVLAKNAEGIYTISGIVSDPTDIAELKKKFASLQLQKIKFNLILAKDALLVISKTLSEYQLSQLTVFYDENSKQVGLKGFTKSYPRLEDLEIELNNKYPQIGQIDVAQVYDQDQATADIDRTIKSIASDSLAVSYNLEKNQINISGFLEKSNDAPLKQKISQLNSNYPLLKVENDIKDVNSVLPFRIFSVYTGEPSFIVIDGGQQVFVGGDIDGFKLQSITNGQIVFGGKFKLVLPINQVLNFYKPQTVPLSGAGVDDTLVIDQDITERDKILAQEAEKTRAALITEIRQITEFAAYKRKITDKNLQLFIESQILNLKKDILVKQHDIKLLGTK